MSTRIEWASARTASVEVLPPGEELGCSVTYEPTLVLCGGTCAIYGSVDDLLALADAIRRAAEDYAMRALNSDLAGQSLDSV